MKYGERPEAFDTRWVFRAYAVSAVVAGCVLIAWGPLWLGTDLAGEKYGKAALIRVFGAILIGAGICAKALTAIDHPDDRRRALFWFIGGHGVVLGTLILQQVTIWGHGIGERAAGALAIVILLLLYVTVTAEGEFAPKPLLTTLFGNAAAAPTADLRSRYEQQIREAARQEERNRLARDLHDSIKQQIFVIQTAAATVQARFEADPPGAREALDQVRAAARDAVTEMQAMLDQLRAEPLENTGLVEAMRKQCDALGLRSGARVEFKLGMLPPSEALPPGAHEALLRAAQEALANVGRHARASHVVVSLNSAQGSVELRVKDDGAGFDPARTANGLGIANMHARAEELSGVFVLNSSPGAGTSVLFSIPYIATEPPEEYRRKAWVYAFCAVILVGLFFWRNDWMMVFLGILSAIWTVRYVVAYRRVRGAAR